MNQLQGFGRIDDEARNNTIACHDRSALEVRDQLVSKINSFDNLLLKGAKDAPV